MAQRIIFFAIILVLTISISAIYFLFFCNNNKLEVDQDLLNKVINVLRKSTGTIWCGGGSLRPKHECNILGENVEADKCCREHDHCPYAFLTNQSFDGFKWNGKFTLSHCECDIIFYKCLSSKSDVMSRIIKLIFFSSITIPCFAYQPCNETVTGTHGECLNNYRVAVFDTLYDYSKIMIRFNNDSKSLVVERLKQFEFPSLYSNSCSHQFSYLYNHTYESYENTWFNESVGYRLESEFKTLPKKLKYFKKLFSEERPPKQLDEPLEEIANALN